jgi:hypothetical protein
MISACLEQSWGIDLERVSSLKFPKTKEQKVQAEKIQGMFGLTLGEFFDIRTATDVTRSMDGSIIYKFKPNPSSELFTSFEVRVTPLTHRVVSLVVQGNNPAVRDELMKRRMEKEIRDRFGIQPQEVYTSMGLCQVSLQGGRAITFWPNFGNLGGVALKFTDVEMELQAKRELENQDDPAVLVQAVKELDRMAAELEDKEADHPKSEQKSALSLL